LEQGACAQAWNNEADQGEGLIGSISMSHSLTSWTFWHREGGKDGVGSLNYIHLLKFIYKWNGDDIIEVGIKSSVSLGILIEESVSARISIVLYSNVFLSTALLRVHQIRRYWVHGIDWGESPGLVLTIESLALWLLVVCMNPNFGFPRHHNFISNVASHSDFSPQKDVNQFLRYTMVT